MANNRNNDPEYSIVVCNLNMADSIEESLQSIMTQVDDRYEILVVDGGSTDGSLDILRDLSSHDERIRIILTEDLSKNSLGADRNIGVQEARGNHVLLQLDADDKFKPVIQDFVNIYEALRSTCEQDFYLSGHGINVGPKDFLLSYGPYRDGIHRGEDMDMWRRMLADNSLIQLSHDNVCEPLGYEPNSWELIQQRFSELIGEFQSGVTLRSRSKAAFNQNTFKMMALEWFLIPLAYFYSLRRESYTLPEPFEDGMELEVQLNEIERDVHALTKECEPFNIDDVSLSSPGENVFK